MQHLLTYHSANGRLMCHYCGYSVPYSRHCPSCGSDTVTFRGRAPSGPRNSSSSCARPGASGGHGFRGRQYPLGEEAGPVRPGEYDVMWAPKW
ncbi:MAG: hypothetical protein ACLRSY_01395 [Acutalibacter sp.]